MPRVSPYLGIVFALIVGASALALVWPGASVAPAQPVATSTSQAAPPVTTPAASSSAQTASQPVPTTKAARAPEPSAKTAARAPAAAPAPQVPARPVVTAAMLDAAAATLRGALVNILCYVPQGSVLRAISGGGVFIDPKGVILTDAHIAQYFLLADRGVSCEIRAGSPAVDTYDAAPMYISPVWIRHNANVLTEALPTGTGEDDFALLGVTGAVSGTLPAPFPFIPLAQESLYPGDSVVIASYGAQFLSSSQIRDQLSPIVTFGSVKAVYTFATSTIDVADLGGSAAAQEGSSGGGVANGRGELAAIITTSTVDGPTVTRQLNAITTPYVSREFSRETGTALASYLAQPPAAAIASFAPEIPGLEAVITANLQ